MSTKILLRQRMLKWFAGFQQREDTDGSGRTGIKKIVSGTWAGMSSNDATWGTYTNNDATWDSTLESEEMDPVTGG